MALVSVGSIGMWMPVMPGYLVGTPLVVPSETFILDADEEEAQLIGPVTIAGGGSKTFGTSSKIGWAVGATPTFASGSTLRVGVKKASSISTTLGPPARATIGAASFDVYDDLVGGTDTLTTLTWREETMTAGTPFTVTDGDLLAICFHLNVTSGTPSVRIRAQAAGGGTPNSAVCTLVTSAGATFTGQASTPGAVVLFNDGTLGWLDPSKASISGDVVSSTLGSGNSFGNIFQVPFPCQVDALAAYVVFSTGAADMALELWSTPLGTPAVMSSVALDANVTSFASGRIVQKRFASPVTLAANTAYAMSVKQTTATGLTTAQYDVPNAAYLRLMGLDANCYAANSTAGATFAVQNSGLRRYLIWARISAVDDGAGGALRTSRIPKREALRFARSRA